ncbi:MAG: oligosaccharide flippase family protein [Sphingobacteriales bacterium]|jgi:O-antigen/teichoic acid export membrane protein|nr:oligosaccharide flippase family protein [Sphingobacteriales bacterium]
MQAVSGKINQVFTLTIGNAVVSLLNLLAAPFLVRWLSTDHFGTYNQVIMICMVFQTLSTFSLHGAVSPLLTRFAQKKDLVLSTCLRLFFYSAIVVSAICLFSTQLVSVAFSNPELARLLPVATIYFTGQAIIPILNSVLYFHGLVRQSVFHNVIFTGFRILLMFLIIHGSADLFMLLLCIGLVSWTQAFFLFFSIPVKMRLVSRFDTEISKSAIQISRPLTLSSFLERILYNVDGFTVSVLLSAGVFAYYKAGAIDVPLIASLGTAAFSVVLPQISQLFYEGNHSEITRIKRSVMATIAFFTYPVLVFILFFHREIIGFYLTERYLPAAIVFAVYNLVILLKVYDWQDVIVLSGNSKGIFYYTALALLLNVILSPILVLFMGFIGAAVAFVISLFFLGFLQLRKMSAILNCHITDLMNPFIILKILGTSVAMALLFKFITGVVELENLTVCLMFLPFLVATYWVNKKLGLLPHEITAYFKSKNRLFDSILR